MNLLLIFSILTVLNCGVCAKDSIKLIDNKILISWKHYGAYTSFLVSTEPLPKNLKKMWLGVGLNLKPDMANTSVVLCRLSPQPESTPIQHYLNTNAYNSFPFDPKNLTIGLNNGFLKMFDDRLYCSFDRRNDIFDKQGYFRVNTDSCFYILAAYGSGKKIAQKFLKILIAEIIDHGKKA